MRSKNSYHQNIVHHDIEADFSFSAQKYTIKIAIAYIREVEQIPISNGPFAQWKGLRSTISYACQLHVNSKELSDSLWDVNIGNKNKI